MINRTTLREQVLEALRSSIISGELRPGDRLAEVELADTLNVSRGTVREALRHLQQSGLIEGAERNTLRVRTLSAQDIRDLFELRSTLEGQAAVNIVRRNDRDEVIDSLEAVLPPADDSLAHSERFRVDLEFHQALCEAGGNKMIVAAWNDVYDLMWVVTMSSPNEFSKVLMSKSNHEPLIEALKSYNPVKIRRVVEEHMARAADNWAGRVASDDGVTA